VTSSLALLERTLRPFSETPALDAQILLSHITKKPRAWILAHPEYRLSPEEEDALEEAVSRLRRGVPLPYVLGWWEFYGLKFRVTPSVLIPRPETELLVEHALAWLRTRFEEGESSLLSPRVLEVGTGSGCIAVTLAVHLPALRIVATDISAAALDVARENAKKHGVADRIDFICTNLFDAPLTPAPFDLILANLPYIPTQTLRSLPVFRSEPALALDGGADGLSLIRALLNAAPKHLASGGMILLEIEASQGTEALALAYDAFSQADIKLFQDLSGRDRLIAIQTLPAP
jgi:release factor glutamine methyltransferase